MCFFKPKPPIIIPPVDNGTVPLVLPHPEEPPDYTRNLENTNVSMFYDKWFTDWEVPEQYHLYWQLQIDIKLDMTILFPAGTWTDDTGTHMVCRPEYMNAGVIAHENSHNSRRLLTEDECLEFETRYCTLVQTDKLMVLLDVQNSYMNTTIVEAHAEVYRYLGQQMPTPLKKFYPRLF